MTHSPRRRPARRSTRAVGGAALAAVLVFAPVTAVAADAPATAASSPAPTASSSPAPTAGVPELSAPASSATPAAAPAAPAAPAAAAVDAMNYVVNAVPGAVTTEAASAAVVAAGGTVLARWDEIGVVTARSTAAGFVDRVRASSSVESAGPTRTAAVRATPDADAGGDAESSAVPSTGVQATGLAERVADVADPGEERRWNDQAVHAAEARAVQPGTPAVLVGVLDSGIDATHPDLVSQVDPAASVGCSVDGVADPDPAAWAPSSDAATSTREHGTHVAGIIAAADDGRGVVGVAPGVRLASVKVVDADGFIYPEYAICGYMWAAQQQMDVTNASFFVDPWAAWCSADPDQAPALDAVARAVAWSQHEGVLDVAAAGNATVGAVAVDLAHKTADSLSPNDSTPQPGRDVSQGCSQLPAEVDGVVTVSSAQQGGSSIEKSRFSNYGAGVVDLTAPGAAVLSTVPGGGFAALSGTSMAAPHVAGVAALLASVHPGATPAELRDLLARQAGGETPSEYFGAGMVDAFAAVTEDRGRGAVAVAPDGVLQAGAAATLRGAGFVPGETVRAEGDAFDDSTSTVADQRGRVQLPVRLSPGTPTGPLSFSVVGSSGSGAVVDVEVQEALAGPVVTSPADGDRLPSGQAVVVEGTSIDSARVAVTVEPAGSPPAGDLPAGDLPATARALAAAPAAAESSTVRAEQDGTFRATFAGLAAGAWQVSAVTWTVDDVVSATGTAVLFAVDPVPAPVPGDEAGVPAEPGAAPAGPGSASPTPGSSPGEAVVPTGAPGRPLAADPARASSAALAWTGSEPGPVALAALLIVAFGVVGVGVGRRRRVDETR
ncbi:MULTISPECIES: S8 family serine peptidase [unclassified Frigoribacterium]|uniref:S8 family serine peptidase n=1 Tax=unclassified Frigoribacterium TaxID=2627005 RepID=UPI001F3977B2|nr:MULTISPECIES: S8 family serine peptidase [unclassified Frigoribacterium]WAC51764.1 S8 family serine peptidase [Frigoribacterium sp. SL97]